MGIVKRADKGSPLTHNEMDANWTDSSGRVRIDVRNESGATLAVGTVVKATGYNLGQDKVTVAPTTASSDVAFGVIDEALANNTNGTVVNTGLVEDTDTSAWTVGTKLYSDGSGGFTSTKPTVPYQTCAFVLRSNANNGRLYVEFTEQHEALTDGDMPSGSVLQVVQSSTSTEVYSTTDAFVDTTLSATITPSSSSSKILVFVSQQGVRRTSGSSANMADIRLLRGTSTLIGFASAIAAFGTAETLSLATASTEYLDSPATTSAITYKTDFRSRNNTAGMYVQYANVSTSTITLMEISA